MPYELSWLVPDHIILLRSFDSLTNTDMRAAVTDIQREMSSAIAQVHLIVDNRDLHVPPTDIDHLSPETDLPYTIGYTLLLDRNPVARLVGSVIANALGSPTRSTSDLDEALSFLQAIDPSLI